MISSYHLDRAVSLSIITGEQAEALRKLARTQAVPEDQREIDFEVDPEDEPFRLLKGFRDFFIAIGIVILASGLSMLVSGAFPLLFENRFSDIPAPGESWLSFLVLAVLIVVAIVISEWVTRAQRLPLSSLVLTVVFALWAGLAGASLYYAILSSVLPVTEVNSKWLELSPFAGILFSVIALILFYLRYRLPFVLLPLALAAVLAGSILANMALDFDHNPIFLRLFFGFSGLVTLAVAMKFDLMDRFRMTRISECAFWLHLLAAPLIVHTILFDVFDGPFGSIVVLMLILVLSIFALIIDRRAILVSALAYLGYSLSQLMEGFSLAGEYRGSAVFVILGIFILVLGLGWTKIRNFLVRQLIWKSLRERLPPVTE